MEKDIPLDPDQEYRFAQLDLGESAHELFKNAYGVWMSDFEKQLMVDGKPLDMLEYQCRRTDPAGRDQYLRITVMAEEYGITQATDPLIITSPEYLAEMQQRGAEVQRPIDITENALDHVQSRQLDVQYFVGETTEYGLLASTTRSDNPIEFMSAAQALMSSQLTDIAIRGIESFRRTHDTQHGITFTQTDELPINGFESQDFLRSLQTKLVVQCNKIKAITAKGDISGFQKRGYAAALERKRKKLRQINDLLVPQDDE